MTLFADWRCTFFGVALTAAAWLQAAPTPQPVVMTVTGPVDVSRLGLVLSHEHIMSTFGAEPAATPGYDKVAVLGAVEPALRALHAAGVGTVVEATAAYFGRDVHLLRLIAERTGLQVVTNTGYYGAANGRYLPPELLSLTATEVAARWIAEWRDGIAGSGIRPGFIKLGVNAGPLRPVDRLLVAAAAQAHLATGLTIAVHTGANDVAAAEQLSILAAAEVSPEAWIWVHAQNAVAGMEQLIGAGRRGAWLSLDGWTPALVARDLETLKQLKAAGLLHRVLLSHDGNLYPAAGGKPRPMDWLVRSGRATLLAAGFTEEEWQMMTRENPARAYAVAVRTRRPAP